MTVVTDIDLNDCPFYQKIDLPAHGVIPEPRDLRGGEHRRTGRVDFEGRVLEIGPASGFTDCTAIFHEQICDTPGAYDRNPTDPRRLTVVGRTG